MASLPISVVVPHKESRDLFFHRYCLPAIEANKPAQIIVETNDGAAGSGAKFRNSGAAKARRPYLIFVDDDVILAKTCLERQYEALVNADDERVRYVYCDYAGIVIPPGRHPLGPTFVQYGQSFDPDRLKRGNFISPMSLMHRQAFPGFDASLKQFDDWDLWLTMLDCGFRGRYVSESLFMVFFLDHGVTDPETAMESIDQIKKKHGIGRRPT